MITPTIRAIFIITIINIMMGQMLLSLSCFEDFGMGLVLCRRLIFGSFHLIG